MKFLEDINKETILFLACIVSVGVMQVYGQDFDEYDREEIAKQSVKMVQAIIREINDRIED
jgi:hypothetical protein